MNILLWVLQILLAVHTLIGAMWKFSNPPEKSMLSLTAIPVGIWKGLSVLEILVAACLVLPLVYKPAAPLVAIAALFIVLEMLTYCGLHLFSDYSKETGPLIYWFVVALICGFIAYGRLKLSPL